MVRYDKKFLFLILIFVTFSIFTLNVLLSQRLKSTKKIPPQLKIHSESTRNNSTNITQKKQVEYEGNLPDVFREPVKFHPKPFNKTCAPFPQIFDIHFTNDIWQTQHTSNGTFQLFNAFYDRRVTPHTVRIIVMLDRLRPAIDEHTCQVWFKSGEGGKKKNNPPILVPVSAFHLVWIRAWGGDKKPGIYQPYIVTCELPKSEKRIPSIVSLVERPCERATNSLRVNFIENQDKKKRDKFAVCVKGLNYPDKDKSARLAEWIELLHLLGASKVIFYKFNIHPNIQKLLDHYTARDMIELYPITLVGDSSNIPWLQSMFLQKQLIHRRLQEVIPYNDCLYRHLYTHEYVVLLDVDEVIVPVNNTWNELIEVLEAESRTNKKNISSYASRNVYFLDEFEHDHSWFEGIPKYMHMLQHVHRSQEYTKPGSYVKCFHSTRSVLALHNHFPMHCLNGCKTSSISTTLAQLQHYRKDCVMDLGKCKSIKQKSVMDTRLWNFKDILIRRVRYALHETGLLRGIEADELLL